MKKSFITLSITFLAAFTALGQSVTISPSNAAIIEANGTNKGILIPRVTTAQRNAMFGTAVTGLMVYDTDLKDMYIFNGFWKRATIGEMPIVLFGNIANQGIIATQNDATFGIGLHGTAAMGTGLVGITNSGTGISATATTTGLAGVFNAQSGSGIFVNNTTIDNNTATARFLNNTAGGKALDITGTIVQTTDKNGDGILATNTNANGVAIKAIGTHMGIRAQSTNGTAILGDSFAGRGIEGNSNSGNGLAGISVTGNAGIFQNNSLTNPSVWIKNLNTNGMGAEIANNSTSQPTAKFINNVVGGQALELTGTMNLISDLSLAPAAFFNNTNTNGIGLKSEGNHIGVHGVSNSGPGSGVHGYSTFGIGTLGAASSGNGIKGESETGSGGVFVNNTNTNPTVKIENLSSGASALEIIGTINLSTQVAGGAISSTNTSNLGTGSGVEGISTMNGIGVRGQANAGIGVLGITQSNFGVYGQSSNGTAINGDAIGNGTGGKFTSATGKGIEVENTSATLPTASLKNNTSGGTAIAIDGAIKVSGTNPAAFVITATAGNTIAGSPTAGGVITIPNTTLANNPNDILIVTHAFGTYLNIPFGVIWTGTNWLIYLEQLNSNMPIGTKFNVLVIKQ